MLLIIGQSGVIAEEIRNAFISESIMFIGKESTRNWSSSAGLKHIQEYTDALPTKPSRIINCAGLTDPKKPEMELIELNYLLPKNLLDFSNQSQIPIVTFGSVMESIPEMNNANMYLKSKTLFFDYFREYQYHKTGNIHLQLHTLYGGKRYHPHMFLGQLIESIKEDEVFRMSSGNQLREYHHVQDDIRVLKELFNLKRTGIVTINHNEKLSLRRIAEYVFSELDKSHLLRIGDLQSPEIERYYIESEGETLPRSFGFRETLPGILENVREYLGESH